MPAILFDLVVLIGLLYVCWLGSAKGIYATSVAGLEVFACLIFALLTYEPLASILAWFFQENLSFFLPESTSWQAWAVFLAFMTVMWGPLLVIWLAVHPRLTSSEIATFQAIDTAGGFIAGGFAGAVFIGTMMITWSMCPLLGFFRIPAQYMYLDVGKTALRTAGRFGGDVHEGRFLPLYGEPASRESDRTARLATETWYDTDANNKTDEYDPYFDVDGNGVFTRELYYIDVDGSRSRRVGQIEKYTVGRWDGLVIVNDRDRPKPGTGPGGQKPRPESPPPAAAKPDTESAPMDIPPAPPDPLDGKDTPPSEPATPEVPAEPKQTDDF